jgi:hypothetical protein
VKKPVSAAIERINRFVASGGVVRNVRSITRSSLMVRGGPARTRRAGRHSDPSKSAAPLANGVFMEAAFGRRVHACPIHAGHIFFENNDIACITRR